MKPRSPGSRKTAFSIAEVLLALLLFGLVSSAIYHVLFQYSRSFLLVSEKLENVAEGWQIMRMLNDDLSCADIPDSEDKNWSQAVHFSDQVLTIQRRRDGDISRVTYLFDPDVGNVVREEGGKRVLFVRTRCKSFSLVTREITPSGKPLPTKIYYHVKLDLGEPRTPRTPGKPVTLEANIIPVFLNLRLRKTYLHSGLPPEISPHL
jgi:hypothetical protein